DTLSNYYTIRMRGYLIDNMRMRELQGFCGQYDKKVEELKSIYSLSSPPFEAPVQGGTTSNPTEQKAARALKLKADIDVIDECIKTACHGEEGMVDILKNAVTHNLSYGKLGYVPESVNKFGLRRRRFYYLLDKRLNER
ncbi:MAG: hypothetical protein IJL00_07645, partial [Clostridia bacterium]|nr:hypothetical protein [Clostridia bacterium]